MKNVIILLISLFSVCGSLSAQQKVKMNVASFNLRYDNPGDGIDTWSNRKDMVTSLIQFHDFDVFGTQEGLINQIKAIAESDTYAYVGGGRDDGKEAGEHSAVFYKKERFELLDKGDFWFSQTPDVPSYGWDAVKHRRICSWAKLKEKSSGKEFYFFSLHFDHQGVEARRESAKLLIDKIKAIAGNIPTICVGDFNSKPLDEPIQIIKRADFVLDAREITKTPPYGTLGTVSQFKMEPNMKDRIDYIWVTKGITVSRYATLNESQYGRFPSDHFPIMATVIF
ncbi:endonuclease/exonuclease/phosphatase family protein [Dysgonomonas sp. ZJ279]|uniref:endonuclease/exonuclease/phosphatase family protein n=1 Tax=Dysgonomonas sp. ZJ279 TaxID=2709796 RepID=UPI0013EAE8C4|nr:endonuclease/exonuclease/phosphatase family protein [Dysgonomonas sp. ZJ279]